MIVKFAKDQNGVASFDLINYNFEHVLIEQYQDCRLIVWGVSNLNSKTLLNLINDLRENNYPGDYIDGQFNIFANFNDKSVIATSLIGADELFYCENNGTICFSNKLDDLFNLKSSLNATINPIGLAQSLTKPFFSAHTGITVFNEIKVVDFGSLFELNSNCTLSKPIDVDNVYFGQPFILEKVKDSLLLNMEIFSDKEILCPISGGVDSKITLWSIIKNANKKVITFSHGFSKDIDSKIAQSIAADLGLEFDKHLINPQNLGWEHFDTLIKYGFNIDSFKLLKWLPSHISLSGRNVPTTLLFGDVLDILRGKNLKSHRRNRFHRIAQYFKISSKNDRLLTIEQMEEFLIDKYVKELGLTYHRYKDLFDNLNINLEQLISDVVNEYRNFFTRLKKIYHFNNPKQFEEVYYVYTWGARTMGAQCRQFNYLTNPYIHTANRRLFKTLIGMDVSLRQEDYLTKKILKGTILGKFPTNQVPFLKYEINTVIYYLFWGFRVLMDNCLNYLKRGARLFPTINYSAIYNSYETKLFYIEKLNFRTNFSFFQYDISKYFSIKTNTQFDLQLTTKLFLNDVLKKLRKRQ